MIIAGGIVLNNSEMLRNAFWEDDKKQGGMIFNQYQEIKKVLENVKCDLKIHCGDSCFDENSPFIKECY